MDKLRKHEKITVKIEKLAFGGAGIGYLEHEEKKLVVFVENVVPGDSVEAQITKIKPNYLEARLVEIKKPSELRIEPRCKHFNICGGCTMQNLKYEDQLKIKENQVREALSHIGGIKDPNVLPIIGFNKGDVGPWFYRNKMEFSFGRDSVDKVSLGLHPRHYRYDVFQVEECFLENSDIAEMVRAVADFMNQHKMPVYNYKNNTGLLRTFTVREGKRTGGRMVNLVVSDEPFALQKEFIAMLTEGSFKETLSGSGVSGSGVSGSGAAGSGAAGSGAFREASFKAPTTIYLTRQIVKKGHRTEFVEELLYGKPYLSEKMQLDGEDAKNQASASLEFEILPQSFFQPNTLQAEVLYKTVLNLGKINNKQIVYDLFCGTGTIGLFCAHKAGRVMGVDINESAVSNASVNAQKNGLKNIEFYIGDVFDVISEKAEKPDLIIVDPPRAGMGDKLCEHLLAVGAPKIVYVSCNPATLARDLKVLCRKYNLQSAQPVDMFPHTYHIETVCELKL